MTKRYEKPENITELQTEARTTLRGKPHHTLPVHLDYGSMGFVIAIGDTGGRWYLQTLLGADEYHDSIAKRRCVGPRDVVAIDAGQQFDVVNMREIIREALDLIEDWAIDFVRS